MEPRIVLFISLLLVATDARKRPNGKARMRNRETRDDFEGSCDLEVSCKSGSMLPIKLPIRGPRGPPGPIGNKGDSGLPGTAGFPGIPGISTSPDRVAFFAGLKKNVNAVQDDSDIAFSAVVTNVGSAYDPVTGKFTAPYNGTYHFTAVVSAQGGHRAAVMLVKNGIMIATIWAESFPTWGTASNSIIIDLKVNDQVWLIQLKRAPYLHGYMYSTFSGMILFRDRQTFKEAND